MRIENVSTAATLKLSNGQTAPAPNAPGLWVVHTEPEPLFTAGAKDRGRGLEALAEDGNPAVLAGAVQHQRGIVASGTFLIPAGDAMPGPATPDGPATEGCTATAICEPVLTLPLAGLAAVIVSLIVGLPCFRLLGPYFSIATIGVGEAARVLALNLDQLTGGKRLTPST